jgi:hypothetical protein
VVRQALAAVAPDSMFWQVTTAVVTSLTQPCLAKRTAWTAPAPGDWCQAGADAWADWARPAMMTSPQLTAATLTSCRKALFRILSPHENLCEDKRRTAFGDGHLALCIKCVNG